MGISLSSFRHIAFCPLHQAMRLPPHPQAQPPTPELIGMWGSPSSRPPPCCWWRPGQAPHLVMLCCSFFHCEEEMVVVPSSPGVGWCSPPLLPDKGVTQEGAPLSYQVEM